MSSEDERKQDRQGVAEAGERVRRAKERMLEADRDRNEDLYNLAERKLEEAETEMQERVDEYKQKHGGQR